MLKYNWLQPKYKERKTDRKKGTGNSVQPYSLIRIFFVRLQNQKAQQDLSQERMLAWTRACQSNKNK